MEEWKEIEGFEGLYKVSNQGYIYSYVSKKTITGYVNNMGWKWVDLKKNGESKYLMVHKLVAQHFVPNPNNYSGVRTKKGKTNCHYKNLEWYCNAQDNKAPRHVLIEHYKNIEQGEWWPLQKMLYKFFITQDSSHIEYIFKRANKGWYGFVLKITHDEHAAQDILQDCYEMFLDAINEGRFRIDRCYIDYAPDTYIMAIIKNQACNWKRDRFKSSPLIDEYFYEGDFAQYD